MIVLLPASTITIISVCPSTPPVNPPRVTLLELVSILIILTALTSRLSVGPTAVTVTVPKAVFVNVPAAGVVPPIGVPLIVPPVISTAD